MSGTRLITPQTQLKRNDWAAAEIIIADEPTGALDSQNTQEILGLLDQIAKDGKLVITVTHSETVANHGTRIVRLADGKISEDTTLKAGF